MLKQQRSESQQTGFTLIELMVVLTIIAIILGFLVPNFWAAIQLSRQTKMVNATKRVGSGCMQWVLANKGSALVSDPVNCTTDYPVSMTRDEVAALLSPGYISYIPEFGPWGHPIEYNFSGSVLGPQVFCLRSPGRNGVFETDTYPVSPFLATDYDQDIVWADGVMVRWPQ